MTLRLLTLFCSLIFTKALATSSSPFEKFQGRYRITKCASDDPSICRLKFATLFNDGLGDTLLKLERQENSATGTVDSEVRTIGIAAPSAAGVTCELSAMRSVCSNSVAQQKVEFVSIHENFLRMTVENTSSTPNKSYHATLEMQKSGLK